MTQDISAAQRIAGRVCIAASNASIPNGAYRVLAWVAGAAVATKSGFPLDITMREIRDGIKRGGVEISGCGCHHSTITSSLQWLEDAGMIKISEGSRMFSQGASKSIEVTL